MDLPDPVARIAATCAALPGAVAVVLGGSRATGEHRPDSDWDLGLYYRGAIDPSPLREHGYVSQLGEWGPIVNGGAWLTVEGVAIDVLLRDLDVVERWAADAEQGVFEILPQTGTLVGAPTYQLAGELAIARVLHGDLGHRGFPPALRRTAPPRWRDRASAALLFAQQHERAGDGTASGGMLAAAALNVAHGRLAERGEFVLNEKRLLARAGLEGLPQDVGGVAERLGIDPLTTR